MAMELLLPSRRYKMKNVMILIFGLLMVTSYAFTDNSNPENYKPQFYDDAKVLRVKFTEGETYVKRSYDEGNEDVSINLPIFEKDTAGTTEGRMEVYLGRLNYLRLDDDSEVIFEKVPALQKTDLTLRVNHGGIYLDLVNLDYERDVEIQTPDCGVFLLDKGLYRINVNEGGLTEVYVVEGVAEVSGDQFSRNVRENQKISMLEGRVKERPYYFNSSDSDEFDKWNRDRDNTIGYARNTTSRYLENGYEEYESELSRNGRWQYDSTYSSNIWIPYNVDADWIPYSNGRWVWNPNYGYTWCSYDSWGYFTHHYGRWHWDPVIHWYWIPGYHWSPAWVCWGWDNDYYSWCPLSWWDRPVIVIGGRWWRDYDHHHGIPFNCRSNIIIKRSQLTSPNIRQIALRGNTFDSSMSRRSISFRGDAPNMRPMYNKIDVVDAKGRVVMYKENSIVSNSKFRDRIVTNNTPLSNRINERHSNIVNKYSGSTPSSYSSSSSSQNTVFKDKGTDSFRYKPANSTKSNSNFGDSSINIKGRDRGNDGFRYRSSADSGNSSNSNSNSNSNGNGKDKNKGTVFKYNPGSGTNSTPKSSSDPNPKPKKKKDGDSYYPSASSSYSYSNHSSYNPSSSESSTPSYRSYGKYSSYSNNSHTDYNNNNYSTVSNRTYRPSVVDSGDSGSSFRFKSYGKSNNYGSSYNSPYSYSSSSRYNVSPRTDLSYRSGSSSYRSSSSNSSSHSYNISSNHSSSSSHSFNLHSSGGSSSSGSIFKKKHN